jgi:hypothetical protein
MTARSCGIWRKQGKTNGSMGTAAMRGKRCKGCIPEGTKNRVHEKEKRNKPLTKAQKRKNKAKPPIRARAEHVFGTMAATVQGITMRSIGTASARFNIGLMNLAYNPIRYAYLRRIGACA